jgi:hypothetical protein
VASREPDDRHAAAGKAGSAKRLSETRFFAGYEHLVSAAGSSAAAASPLAARRSH